MNDYGAERKESLYTEVKLMYGVVAGKGKKRKEVPSHWRTKANAEKAVKKVQKIKAGDYGEGHAKTFKKRYHNPRIFKK